MRFRTSRHSACTPSTGTLIALLALVWFMPTSVAAQQWLRGSLGFVSGYTFERSNLGGNPNDMNGWFATLNYGLHPWVALQGQFTNYLGSQSGNPIDSESIAGGPAFIFRAQKSLQPFVYVLLGNQRSQKTASVSNNFEAQMGGGIQIKLTPSLALKLVPGEYDLTEPSGTSTYVDSIGLAVTFPKSR